MKEIIPYLQILIAGLLITFILLQQGRAAMGSSFGQASFTTRRGPEKTIYIGTIILGSLFVLLAILNLLL